MKKEDIQMLSSIRFQLISKLYEEMNERFESMNAKEAGEVTDMIKDISVTLKECAELEYYETVVESMHAGGSPSTVSRMHTMPITYDASASSDKITSAAIKQLRDAWGPANAESRRKMKSELSKLVSEMVI